MHRHRNRLLAVYVAAMCCALAHQSCARTDTRTPAAAASSAEFTLTIGTGGGFTGASRGYRLHSAGRVESWQRMPGVGDSVLWIARVKGEAIRQFLVRLESGGMFELTLAETGNMTTRVTLSQRDTTLTWSWPQRGGDTVVPDEMLKWHADVRRFCQQASPDSI